MPYPKEAPVPPEGQLQAQKETVLQKLKDADTLAATWDMQMQGPLPPLVF